MSLVAVPQPPRCVSQGAFAAREEYCRRTLSRRNSTAVSRAISKAHIRCRVDQYRRENCLLVLLPEGDRSHRCLLPLVARLSSGL